MTNPHDSRDERTLTVETFDPTDDLPPVAEEGLETTGEQDMPVEDVEEDLCSICLQPYIDRTVIPDCVHEFCFECIMIWTEQSRRCPLCTQTIGSYLMHHIRSKNDYQKYYLPPLRSSPPPIQPVQSRQHLNNVRRRIRGREWGRRPRSEREEADELEKAIDKRRWVYQHDLYAKHVASNPYTRYRPFPTPSQFSASIDLISRATVFIRRELRVWINLDVEFLTTFILALMRSIDIRSESAIKLLAEFLDMDAPYVEGGRHINAEHFAHELYCYMRSPYKNLAMYDKAVQSCVEYDVTEDLAQPSAREYGTRWDGPESESYSSIGREACSGRSQAPSLAARARTKTPNSASREVRGVAMDVRRTWTPRKPRLPDEMGHIVGRRPAGEMEDHSHSGRKGKQRVVYPDITEDETHATPRHGSSNFNGKSGPSEANTDNPSPSQSLQQTSVEPPPSRILRIDRLRYSLRLAEHQLSTTDGPNGSDQELGTARMTPDAVVYESFSSANIPSLRSSSPSFMRSQNILALPAPKIMARTRARLRNSADTANATTQAHATPVTVDACDRLRPDISSDNTEQPESLVSTTSGSDLHARLREKINNEKFLFSLGVPSNGMTSSEDPLQIVSPVDHSHRQSSSAEASLISKVNAEKHAAHLHVNSSARSEAFGVQGDVSEASREELLRKMLRQRLT